MTKVESQILLQLTAKANNDILLTVSHLIPTEQSISVNDIIYIE